VSSAPTACANVLVSLSLSAPMALGTAHIHLLDTKSFSDYSPPMRDRRLSISCPLEKEIIADGADLITKLIAIDKTESATLTCFL
jgi:hypothetical protein